MFKPTEFNLTGIEQAFQEYWPEYSFTDQFKNQIVKYFLHKFYDFRLIEFMHQAGIATDNPEWTLNYFLKICWNKIHEGRADSDFESRITRRKKPDNRCETASYNSDRTLH